MIPKKIHYCWFGRNPKPKLAEKCIKSWKKYCPDYEIVEWNEDNYDLNSAPLYVRQAYDAKKWAFVTDYVRLQVVYEHGGIYMDTDVELVKPLDSLLNHAAYFGFEDNAYIATGLGFGAEKGTTILKEMMSDYLTVPFLNADGTYNTLPCPYINTKVFLKHQLVQDGSRQVLADDILILPPICLCPVSFTTMRKQSSPETISIHWYDASWMSDEERVEFMKSVKQERSKRNKIRCKEAIRRLVGDGIYAGAKNLLKR